ncbi:MAG: pilin [Rudaea sp.]
MDVSRIKLLLAQFLVTLTAVVMALVAYDYYRRPDTEAARAQTQALKRQADALVQGTQSQTQALREQAKSLSEQATALKNEVSAEHRAADAQRERFMAATYRAEGLQAVGAAKVAVAEYYENYGKFPTSNSQVGLAPPDQFKGQSLRRMAISEGGVISLIYDAKSGVDGGTIRLIPDNTHPGTPLKWRCISPNFSDIAVTIPQCSYRAPDRG